MSRKVKLFCVEKFSTKGYTRDEKELRLTFLSQGFCPKHVLEHETEFRQR